MKLLLDIERNEFDADDIAWATVELTPALLDDIRKKKAIFDTARQADSALIQMEFYHDVVQYLNGAEEIEEAIADTLSEDSKVFLLEDGFSANEEWRERVEPSNVILNEMGIRWETMPKHCNYAIQTVLLSWGFLATK